MPVGTGRTVLDQGLSLGHRGLAYLSGSGLRRAARAPGSVGTAGDLYQSLELFTRR